MSSIKKRKDDGATLHRREMRLQIILPMLAGVLLLAVMVSSALLLPKGLQVSLIADLLLTIFVLCPTALCCLLPVALFVVMAVGMNKAHGKLAETLERVEGQARTATDKAAQAMDSVNQRAADASAQFASLSTMVDVFDDRPQSADTEIQEGDGEKNDPDNTP